ncbi:hypothetical protein CDLVIII_1045 [Clostridium sp. DL-VIII]|uniref:hypothetical protein n=1 Tax=Clostridium sp. DL-VIII TaxID=641107 RepID=UPI00023AF36A|nr:hypothetical protein [Clostridium sp. DL-VIII]EHI97748.1 hypothetical protein CDLVIII_1045 [Clostridium sp. DL-VIII]
MSELILLNEVRDEKKKSQLLISDKIKNERVCEESYITFEEKFNLFKDSKESDDLNNERVDNEKDISLIIDRIFLLNNDTLIIDFINAIYNDNLKINTQIRCIENSQIVISQNLNYNIKIFAQDEYRNFEYEIQFKISDYENLGIIISKKDLTNKNIVTFSKRKNNSNIMSNLKECQDKCMIVLDSEVRVPDVYERKPSFNKKNMKYKINVVKGWKYDFRRLFEEKMYLLFPLKVIDLRKRLLDINSEAVSKKMIKDEIFIFFKDMNRYLKRIKSADLIMDRELNKMNLIAIDLLNSLINDENDISINLKMDIQAVLKEMVV